MCSHATIELFYWRSTFLTSLSGKFAWCWFGQGWILFVCLCYVNVRKAACTDLFILSVYISNTG